jgi:hypothetical protein
MRPVESVLSCALARCWWLTPVILATQEAEIRRIMVQSQLSRIMVQSQLSQIVPSPISKKLPQKWLELWLKW